jgi:uracil permease
MAIRNWISQYKLTYKDSLLSIQLLLIAFGALITVPLLTGLDPNVALFTAGVGTLIFHFFTKRVVPVFLASSFAYAAPIMVATKTWGMQAALGGLVVAGLFYILIGAIIQWRGRKIIETLFPPVVTGPVIMVIGLMLAPVAVSMALGQADPAHLIPQKIALLISMISLAATVSVFLFARGTLKLIPILCGIGAGYLISILFGITDFSTIAGAPWIAFPVFAAPKFNLSAILFIVPAAIAPVIAHFGDILAIGEVAEEDYLKDPGIHRTLLGTGVANTFAACAGGPPIRIYAEITGMVTVFKRFEPSLMAWAALFAMVLAFFGKLGALLQTIPSPVIGGILILFIGSLVAVGVKSLKKTRSDLMELRNLLIIALILVSGIGGITFSAGAFTLKGVALATIVGVILNRILPDKKTTA